MSLRSEIPCWAVHSAATHLSSSPLFSLPFLLVTISYVLTKHVQRLLSFEAVFLSLEVCQSLDFRDVSGILSFRPYPVQERVVLSLVVAEELMTEALLAWGLVIVRLVLRHLEAVIRLKHLCRTVVACL